jgi:alpha-L-rhamnosidase
MNSFAHYSFGAVTEWMMTTLAGIAPVSPGYKTIRLHPHFPVKEGSNGVAPITWVKAHHDTPQGRISVMWKRQDDDSLLYEITIPPNSTAELTLPKQSPWGEKESNELTQTLVPGFYQFEVKK